MLAQLRFMPAPSVQMAAARRSWLLGWQRQERRSHQACTASRRHTEECCDDILLRLNAMRLNGDQLANGLKDNLLAIPKPPWHLLHQQHERISRQNPAAGSVQGQRGTQAVLHIHWIKSALVSDPPAEAACQCLLHGRTGCPCHRACTAP